MKDCYQHEGENQLSDYSSAPLHNSIEVKQAKQQEWNTILTVAKNNGFPLQNFHKLKTKIILETQKANVTPIQTEQKQKWVTFTYHSPLKH
jgi:hypothetical protein